MEAFFAYMNERELAEVWIDEDNWAKCTDHEKAFFLDAYRKLLEIRKRPKYKNQDNGEPAMILMKDLSLGQAIEQMWDGEKVARKGWNGENQFLYITHGNTYIPRDGSHEQKVHGDGEVINQPHIDMKTTDGTVCIGWTY